MIYLIRHGMTSANEHRLYCGSSDLALTENGRAALKHKREKGGYPDASMRLIFSSGMHRCNETAMLLFGRAPDKITDDLREINFGIFELHSYAELREDETYQKWISDESGDAVPPDGESSNAFKERVIAAIQAVPDESIVVCHGGVIACLMAHWFPDESKHMYAWQPDFGEGYAVNLREKTYTRIPK